MSKNEFRERYKVNKDSINESYKNQLLLKRNKDYEELVDRSFVEICNYFMKKYEGVKIEPPRGREKSDKSLKDKIKKLEIERLSKLYILGQINDKEKEELYSLVEERIKNGKSKESTKLLSILDIIFNENINEENLEEIEKNIAESKLSNHTKMTLLRMMIKQIEEKPLNNKKELVNNMQEKYGEGAAIREENPEMDLIKYNEIEELKDDYNNQIEKLKDSESFLRLKDLRGIKIVISHVPSDIETDNKELKNLIRKRDEAKTDKQKFEYNDLCCIELEKEFIKELMNDSEFLEHLGIEVMEDSYKHKSKTNGYIADHVKFKGNNNPEFIFELQMRSIYREELSRLNGSAAHDKRPGKERILPNIENEEELINDLDFRLPKYTILQSTDNGFKIHKCTRLENTLAYYDKYIIPGTERYDKIVEILNNREKTGIEL